MFTRLIEDKSKIEEIFKQHKVVRAHVFGSALSDNFSETSDVDFLIKFQEQLSPLEKGELWWELHDSLRDFLKREIDLVTEGSLKNPYFIEELNNSKLLIYGIR